MYYPENISADDPNASGWVHFYPRRFVLQPGERQTVRIAVRPPSDLSFGEYWARPVIISNPVKHPVSTAEAERSNVLRAGLSTQINTVIALNYRHGDVYTGVEIAGFTENIDADDLSVRVDLTRRGNAAFLGNLILRIRDSNNRVIDELRRDVAVYYDLSRVFTFPRKNLRSGVYTAEVELNTDRQLTGGYILPARPVRKSVQVTIP
jgi:fimbrial chaperone protein